MKRDDTAAMKRWEKTRLQNLVRHKSSGNYYDDNHNRRAGAGGRTPLARFHLDFRDPIFL
jgi:hypothetical protein